MVVCLEGGYLSMGQGVCVLAKRAKRVVRGMMPCDYSSTLCRLEVTLHWLVGVVMSTV